MRTRLVRVRRRPRGLLWAMIFLMLSMALYIRVSLPMLDRMRQEANEKEAAGERVTRETALGGTEIHLVSFGGYNTAGEANVEAARYVSRGAAGYVLKKDMYYVIGAGYAERADAERACALLRAREGIECAVVSMSAPEVILRMTSDSGQIDAFAEAEKLTLGSAELLGQLSFSIDRGETTAKQALEIVAMQLTKTETAQEALEKKSAEKMHPVIEAHLSLIADMNSRMREIGRTDGAMELSSRLKHFQIEFTLRRIDLMNELE